MAIAKLRSAFQWNCPECGSVNWEAAIEQIEDAALDDALAEEAMDCLAQFETLDAQPVDDDEWYETPYLVFRVVAGPSFVKCSDCKRNFAAQLPEMEDEE